MHTVAEIQEAVRELDLWGRLRDDRFCRFHVGDRVDVAVAYRSDVPMPATVLGAQMAGHSYAVLLDTGEAVRSVHVGSIEPLDATAR